MGVLPVKKERALEIGDLVVFTTHGHYSFRPCFAVVVSEAFFKKHAASSMKEILTRDSRADRNPPVFLLRIANHSDMDGYSRPSLGYAIPDEHEIIFICSLLNEEEIKKFIFHLSCINSATALEPNRNVSSIYNIFNQIEKLFRDLKREGIEPNCLYYHFILHLQNYRDKKGGYHGKRKKRKKFLS